MFNLDGTKPSFVLPYRTADVPGAWFVVNFIATAWFMVTMFCQTAWFVVTLASRRVVCDDDPRGLR